MSYQCPLGKFQPSAPDYTPERREAYHQSGTDLISLDNDTDLNFLERQVVAEIFKRRWGPRRSTVTIRG